MPPIPAPFAPPASERTTNDYMTALICFAKWFPLWVFFSLFRGAFDPLLILRLPTFVWVALMVVGVPMCLVGVVRYRQPDGRLWWAGAPLLVGGACLTVGSLWPAMAEPLADPGIEVLWTLSGVSIFGFLLMRDLAQKLGHRMGWDRLPHFAVASTCKLVGMLIMAQLIVPALLLWPLLFLVETAVLLQPDRPSGIASFTIIAERPAAILCGIPSAVITTILLVCALARLGAPHNPIVGIAFEIFFGFSWISTALSFVMIDRFLNPRSTPLAA